MNTLKQKIAIIGGTGLTSLANIDIIRREIVMTPYGEPSSPLIYGVINRLETEGAKNSENNELVFLARHGHAHNIPPHRVNYRANLFALKKVGVTSIIAVNAVGGIRHDMRPGSLVVPDQIIDYTAKRINTFYEDNLTHVTHIDFSYPYNAELSQSIIETAKQANIAIIQGATYGATEGPRLETAAEIQRLKNDGCDIVGMTGMPEAALARELGLDYASICVNANWAAGLSDDLISMEIIEENIKNGMAHVLQLLENLLG